MFNFFKKDYEFRSRQIDIHIDWRKFFNIESNDQSYSDFVDEMEDKYGESVGLALGNTLRISLLDINEQGILAHFYVNPTNFSFKYIRSAHANLFIKTDSPEELISILGYKLPCLAINSTVYGLEICITSSNGKERPDISMGNWETLTVIPHSLISTDKYLLSRNSTKEEFQKIKNKFNMNLESGWWSNDIVNVWIRDL